MPYYTLEGGGSDFGIVVAQSGDVKINEKGCLGRARFVLLPHAYAQKERHKA